MRTKSIKAKVESNEDPSKSGKIKVSMADMDGQEYSEWIEPIFPADWIAIPEPGDSVEVVMPEDNQDLIEFPDEVRYRGQILTDSEPVPDEFKENYPYRKGLKTTAGHIIICDDKAGTVSVTNGKSGDIIEMDSSGKISLKTERSDLSNNVTDFILKGNKVHTAFATFLSGWAPAMTALKNNPTIAGLVVYSGVMEPLVIALQTSLTTWLSTKVKTG